MWHAQTSIQIILMKLINLRVKSCISENEKHTEFKTNEFIAEKLVYIN